ncbi:MAG: tRNA dihydrouridine synthase DusB [bacterium]
MQNLIKPLEIGGVTCPNNLVLAPMSGITDSPFRTLCLQGGAGLVTGEMISACALRHNNRKTGVMLKIEEGEHPVSLQIFGFDEASMAEAAKQAEQAGADMVDINAGCPVRKIHRSGSGAMLMKDERLFGRIIAAASSAVKVPVTVKIRCGWKKGDVISPRLARIAAEAGAGAVTLHARPVEAGHAGPADMEAVKATAAAVAIPVIGNGGIISPSGAAAMLEAGCAGVMIGRAAIGNPWIFSMIASALGGQQSRKMAPDRADAFLQLLKKNSAHYGERTGIIKARKIAGYWLKGLPGASALRERFMKASTFNEARAILIEYSNSSGSQGTLGIAAKEATQETT